MTLFPPRNPPLPPLPRPLNAVDGTTNFAHGYPSFSISVAVLQRTLPVAACVVEFSGGGRYTVQGKSRSSRLGGVGKFSDGKGCRGQGAINSSRLGSVVGPRVSLQLGIVLLAQHAERITQWMPWHCVYHFAGGS